MSNAIRVIVTAAVISCAALIAATGAYAHGGSHGYTADSLNRDGAGATLLHKFADGLAVPGELLRQQQRAGDREHLAAERRRAKRAERLGRVMLTDQQVRERVLMQSLDMPLRAAENGFATRSSDISIADGTPVSTPIETQRSLRAIGAFRDGPSASTPAEIGEWSAPVQPSYETFESVPENCVEDDLQSCTQVGDPIVDVDAEYTYDSINPESDNARYWSPNPRIVPVFSALMPDGKILYWDWLISGVMDNQDEHIDFPSTRILLWDPANPTEQGERLDVVGANLFCAGFSHLPNGDLFLAGGNTGQQLAGLEHTWVYHWRTKTWERTQDMERPRWYPSVASLANGESFIMAGDPQDTNPDSPYYLPEKAYPEVFTSNYQPGTQNWDPNSPSDHLRSLTNLAFAPGDPTPPSWRLYPFVFPSLDGRVLYAGDEPRMMLIDPRGSGAYQSFGLRDDGDWSIVREYGSAVNFDRGRTLVSGGGKPASYLFTASQPAPDHPDYTGDPDDCLLADGTIAPANRRHECVGTNTPIVGQEREHGAVDTAALIETTGGERTNDEQGLPTSTEAADMQFRRRLHQLTVLPDGKVLATGGISDTDPSANPTWNANDGNLANDLVNPEAAVYAAEIWDPETDQWTQLDEASTIRQYHSMAMLLPDGRVISGGGGVCGPCYHNSYSEANFEYFSPPYLFNSDGTPRNASQRPAITESTILDGSAEVLSPVEYTDEFDVDYTLGDSGTTIEQVSLIKLPAPTHATDQGQRRVPLEFDDSTPGTLAITAPENAFEASPGFYMLFLIDSHGVPSIAKMIQVGAELPLANKTEAAVAFADEDLDGASQNFGLGEFSAARAHFAPVGDNSIESLTVAAGYHAEVCRDEEFTDCATVKSGDHDQIGTRFSGRISSIRVETGEVAESDAEFLDTSADTTPPAVTLINPVPDSTQVESTATLNFTVTDDFDETPVCDADSGDEIALDSGSNTITIGCIDDAGNGANHVFTVYVGPIDDPATVEITSPADGLHTTGSDATIEFSSTGTMPVDCTVNDDDATSPATVDLVVGANSIEVVCTNAFGSADDTITVHRGTAPTVSITSPIDGLLTTQSSVDVEFSTTGTSPVACTVNGDAATSPATVALTTGANSIVVSCSNDYGSSSGEITVNRGVAPAVEITSPQNGAFTTAQSTTVEFSATGTAPVDCTVNGTPATSPATGDLPIGENTIEVVCDNEYGSGSQTITVNRGIAPAVQI
ncbi:MAG: galactose oxidase-like domain-containing protein, partial [Solirubrobacterales bacterium]